MKAIEAQEAARKAKPFFERNFAPKSSPAKS
jgi:hypothetical protein